MKNIREIALTPYYPYGQNRQRRIAERVLNVDRSLEEHDEEVRQETLKEVLDTMHEIYSADLHCMADMCESPDEGCKCDSCMYFAIKSAIKALSDGKDINVPTTKEGEQDNG